MGLAAVIIGSTIFKKIKFLRITTGVLFGMIIYKACISIALAAGLRSQDTNLMITDFVYRNTLRRRIFA